MDTRILRRLVIIKGRTNLDVIFAIAINLNG